jgi:hypothetical protein
MKKLSLFAVSVSTALVCAAVPASFNSSAPKFSLDTAEARVGRPLTATSVAGVGRRVHRREYRRAATELRLELLLLEAPLLLGQRMSGDLPRPTRPDLQRMSGDLPRPTAPDLRSPQQPLMAGRAMATAQGPTRTP